MARPEISISDSDRDAVRSLCTNAAGSDAFIEIQVTVDGRLCITRRGATRAELYNLNAAVPKYIVAKASLWSLEVFPIICINFIPDQCHIRAKMYYCSWKSAFYKLLFHGIAMIEMGCTDLMEMDAQLIAERLGTLNFHG